MGSSRLKLKAVEAYMLDGLQAMEIAALGFEDPIDDTILWFELKNVATEPGRFFVDADDVEDVLAQARKQCDPMARRIVWHSHYIAPLPSESDYAMLKQNGWIDAGIVFHAPSQRSVLYTSAGIIPNKAESGAARDMEVLRRG